MFGSKINKHTFHQTYRTAKNFLGHAYHHTKHVLGEVDNSVKMAKHIYGAVSPILDSVMGSNYTNLNKNVMKAVSGYDTIRNKVMDSHDSVLHNVDQVSSNLKKHNIDIGI